MRSQTNTRAINIIGKCPACYVIWIEASCRDREFMAIISMNQKTFFSSFFFFCPLIKWIFFTHHAYHVHWFVVTKAIL